MSQGPPMDPERRRTVSVGYFDVLRELEEFGCAVCRVENRSAWRYIDGLLWEGITDPGIRAMSRAAHGFCPEHSLLAITVASRASGQLGMAILFEDLLRHVEGEAAASRPRRRILRRRNLHPDPLDAHASCHVCGSSRASGANALNVLSTESSGSEVGALARADGPKLCLPHLRRGLRLAGSEDERLQLVEIFVTGSEELRLHLAEFIRKRDYRFSHERVTEEEAGGWRRAVYAMVGLPRHQPSDR